MTARIGRPPLARQDLFDEWTAEECWLAGLIWSDGCFFEDTKNTNVRVDSTDLQVIELASAITGAPVRADNAYRGGRKTTYRVVISGDPVGRLRNAGLVPRKSFIAQWPNCTMDVSAFTRGYFDGNGHVGLYRNPSIVTADWPKRLMSNFSGAFPLLARLQDVLLGQGIARRKLSNHGSVGRLQYNHADSLRLAEFMYADNGPCLIRKRMIFEKACP